MLQGFPPVADSRARCLILGSMPGRASLAAGEYYAHRHNAFWKIMGELVGAAPDLPYPQRLVHLHAAGIALWDVIAACEREGSLDAEIVGSSVRVNDFPGFFSTHPGIERVFFNGAAAEGLFRRHVLPVLGTHRLQFQRLPSTSPAHAALRYERKLEAWREIVAPSGMAASGSV